MAGCRGREKHVEIVNRLKNKLNGKYDFIADDWLMMTLLDTNGDGGCPNGGRKEGALIPDFLIIIDGYIVVGEVGKFNPDKWPANLPVIHIGFNGRVRFVGAQNTIGNLGVRTVIKEISLILNYNYTQDIGAYNCGMLDVSSNNTRFNKIIGLLKQGYTTQQISKLRDSRLVAYDNSNNGRHLTKEGIKHVIKNEVRKGGIMCPV